MADADGFTPSAQSDEYITSFSLVTGLCCCGPVFHNHKIRIVSKFGTDGAWTSDRWIYRNWHKRTGESHGFDKEHFKPATPATKIWFRNATCGHHNNFHFHYINTTNAEGIERKGIAPAAFIWDNWEKIQGELYGRDKQHFNPKPQPDECKEK